MILFNAFLQNIVSVELLSMDKKSSTWNKKTPTLAEI